MQIIVNVKYSQNALPACQCCRFPFVRRPPKGNMVKLIGYYCIIHYGKFTQFHWIDHSNLKSVHKRELVVNTKF